MNRQEVIQILYSLIYEKIQQYDSQLTAADYDDYDNKNKAKRNLDLMYDVKRYLDEKLK